MLRDLSQHVPVLLLHPAPLLDGLVGIVDVVGVLAIARVGRCRSLSVVCLSVGGVAALSLASGDGPSLGSLPDGQTLMSGRRRGRRDGIVVLFGRGLNAGRHRGQGPGCGP